MPSSKMLKQITEEIAKTNASRPGARQDIKIFPVPKRIMPSPIAIPLKTPFWQNKKTNYFTTLAHSSLLANLGYTAKSIC